MSESPDFNPALPESRQFTPPAEGGNGNIHKPSDYHNLIWQTRSRVPEKLGTAAYRHPRKRCSSRARKVSVNW